MAENGFPPYQDRNEVSPLAPEPRYPERMGTNYETKLGQNFARRGPLRFEEGLGTDTDIPNDFGLGIMQGYVTAPGRPNHNANVYEKYPDETMRERAHVGSSSWVEAPTFLGEFAHGSFTQAAEVKYEQIDRSGGRYARQNPAEVFD
jgi:hypothetical protein